ncbi:MAG: hypothetical protein WBG92_06760 [Thiohalocapsa sp.]
MRRNAGRTADSKVGRRRTKFDASADLFGVFATKGRTICASAGGDKVGLTFGQRSDGRFWRNGLLRPLVFTAGCTPMNFIKGDPVICDGVPFQTNVNTNGCLRNPIECKGGKYRQKKTGIESIENFPIK